MKRIVTVLVVFVMVSSSPALASRASSFIVGGFELAGFLNVGAGWQHFSNAPITEAADNGSYAGVLGSVYPGVQTGIPPKPKENYSGAFVEVAELDMTKKFGDRASLAGHIFFGRAASGTWVEAPGISIEQAYLAVNLSKTRDVEFLLGRFSTVAGFEEDEPYFNDTISWSILLRGDLYPYVATGTQLSFDLADRVRLYLIASNGNVHDTTFKVQSVPSGSAILVVNWGPDDKQNTFSITPFVGPESNSNRHLSYGATALLKVWLADPFELGLQALYHRDNGVSTNSNYAASLLNLHYDFTERFFGFLRYTFARQFEAGNGVLNLTGAKQSIHEMSLGAGYDVADGMKLKLETRTDAVVPSGRKTQWVPGIAMALSSAF